MRIRSFSIRTAAMGCASLLMFAAAAPFSSAASAGQAITKTPHRSCIDSASFTTATERIENLRLERVMSGELRNRIVVAGRLDHVHSDTEQQVRLRMTVREPSGVIARQVWDYELPPNVAPQGMILRLLLTRAQTRAVDKAGRAATVVVDVWQHTTPGETAMAGHRHTAVAKRLCERPMPTLPAS